MQTPIQQMASELNQYTGSGNTGHIDNAVTQLDAALRRASGLMAGTDREAADLASQSALRDRIAELEELASDRLKEVAKAQGSASAELGKVEQGVEELRAEVNLAAESLVEAQTKFAKELEAAQALFETQRAQEVETMKVEMAEQVTSFRTEADAQLKSGRSAVDDALSAAKKDTEVVLDALRTSQERATNIVGVIARTGMTGGYQQDAKEQGGTADKWRKYTVGFAIAAVAVLAWAVFIRSGEATTTNQLISRLFLSAALGGIAAYAGTQAHAHRQRSRRARNLELALASLGPYLQDIPTSEDKSKLLMAFAYLFFSPIAEESDDEAVSPMARAQVAALLKRVGPSTEESKDSA